MTVTPLCANLFQDCKELHQFLLVFKQTALQKNQTKILSISLEIPPVDPLAVLSAIAKPGELHFYFEKAGEGEAIAAIDTAASLKVKCSTAQSTGCKGEARFFQAQQFIESVLANTISTLQTNIPFAGPHFFCSFTFYDQPLNGDAIFPPATIFLPRLQVSRQANRSVLVANLAINYQSNIKVISEGVWQQVQLIKEISKEISSKASTYKKIISLNQTDINNFKAAVVLSLESIRAKELSKIVLAHAVDVISTVPFNLVDTLHNLRSRHPGCYIFSTSNGEGKNFIGASPERLISIKDRQLMTDALAGSAPRGKTAAEDAEEANRLLSSEKERREHQVVLDFITQRLRQLGLTPQKKTVPQLLQLSNIQHIWTPIQAQVPEGVHPLEIVAQLHPTPAVAGTPRDIACQQIRRLEPFERSLYAAPLGWIDRQGNSEFVVGIRSALIDGASARLYAGAGIVAGSDPNKELAEIQLKLQALLEALV
jgi:menaquinone-specific isochorismate synthase